MRSKAWCSPASRVSGAYSGASAVGLTETFTRGTIAPWIALEMRIVGPGRGIARDDVDQLVHTRRVPVGLCERHGLLTEEIGRRRFAVAPQTAQLADRIVRCLAGDELTGHPQDVAPRHRRTELRPERHVLSGFETEIECGRQVDVVEVLLEMAHHVRVVGARREHVDESEELRPEIGMTHRPVEETVRPPRHAIDASTFG